MQDLGLYCSWTGKFKYGDRLRVTQGLLKMRREVGFLPLSLSLHPCARRLRLNALTGKMC